MLEIKGVTSRQKVSLSECGGTVMLELDNGDNYAFRQTIDAGDAGKVLGVLNRYSDEEAVCRGDLTVFWSGDKLHFAWHSDGLVPQVMLSPSDVFVFEEAIKSHCKALMKPARTPIL